MPNYYDVRSSPREALIPMGRGTISPTEGVIGRYKDYSTKTTYQSLSLLGKGGFARCYKVRNEDTNELWALKVIDKSRFVSNAQYNKVLREIKIHKSLSHENIVRLECSFEDSLNMYMLMELCDEKSLLALIPEKGVSECDANYYLRGVVSAVQFILSRGIIHRDIKPGNVLLTNGPLSTVKLADFGLACAISEVSAVSLSGTPNYLAPEVLQRKGHSAASEAWSIGCMLFCLVTGKPPFDSQSIQETYDRILKGDYFYPHDVHLSYDVKDLINGLLELNPGNRMRVGDIPFTPFVRPPVSTYAKDFSKRSVTFTSVDPVHCSPRCKSAVSFGSSCALNNNNNNGICSSYGLDSTRSLLDSSSCSHSQSGSSPCPSLILSDIDNHVHTLSALITGMKSLSTCKASPPLHISKWVDYSNKYGFGCLLSDGTVSVKFNSGQIISMTRSDRGVYVSSSSARPVSLSLVQSGISNLVEVVRSYRQYMETQLAQAAKRAVEEGTGKVQELECEEPGGDWMNTTEIPYVMHHSKSSNTVLIFLSTGTAQINYMAEHIKVILSPHSSSHSLVSIIDSDKVLSSFRLSSSSSTLSRHFFSVLKSSSDRILDEANVLRSRFPPRVPLITIC